MLLFLSVVHIKEDAVCVDTRIYFAPGSVTTTTRWSHHLQTIFNCSADIDLFTISLSLVGPIETSPSRQAKVPLLVKKT